MEAQVALIVAFSSSALLGLAYRIFLFTIPHRFPMGLRSGEFAGQLRTVIPWSLNQVLVALALCAGAKSCWKMTSASGKSDAFSLTKSPSDASSIEGADQEHFQAFLVTCVLWIGTVLTYGNKR